MLHVKISGHGREGLGLIKSIQPSALLWPCWNWGGLAWECSVVLLQRDPLEDALHGKSLLLALSASSWCIRIQDDAVSQHHCRIRPSLHVDAATSLWQLAQTVHQPVELRWHHLVLCFGAGRFGQGRDQHVGKARGQLPTKHPGTYLSVHFVRFICRELKRIALKSISQEETSSFADNPPDFSWFSGVSRLALCARHAGHCSVPKAAAIGTGANSLFKALAAIWRLFHSRTVNFLLSTASVHKNVFYFHVCHQGLVVVLGCSSWDAGTLLCHFQGTLLCKNAVGIEMNFLNKETDPFPRPGSVPGYYPKVIWLHLMESCLLFGGVHDLAVQHSLWVGIMSHWPLLIQDCPGVMQGASSLPVSLLFVSVFLCSDCSCSQFLLGHDFTLCFAIPYAYFPPRFYF